MYQEQKKEDYESLSIEGLEDMELSKETDVEIRKELTRRRKRKKKKLKFLLKRLDK